MIKGTSKRTIAYLKKCGNFVPLSMLSQDLHFENVRMHSEIAAIYALCREWSIEGVLELG